MFGLRLGVDGGLNTQDSWRAKESEVLATGCSEWLRLALITAHILWERIMINEHECVVLTEDLSG